MADAHSQRRFDLRFVRRSCGYAGVLQHAVARIKNYRYSTQSAFVANCIQDGRSGGPVTVIGNEYNIRSASILPRGQYQFAFQMTVRFGLRLAIYPDDLLPRRMRRTRQNPGFRHRRITLVLQNPAHRNVLVTECLEQHAARLVIANHTNWKHIYTQIGQVADRIRSASRHHGPFAMFQN